MVRIDADSPLVERDCAPGDYIALLSQAVVATATTPDELHERLGRTLGLGIEQVVVARVERLPSPAAVDAARREYEARIREMLELEKQFPPPDEGELFADARRLQARCNTPELEPYRGMNVAVLNGVIVDRGADELRLRLDLARKLNLHPQRFVIEYVPLREW